MKIRSIELTNFRKFVGTVRVANIGDNVNVLVGRNELGKSTLLEAINGIIIIPVIITNINPMMASSGLLLMIDGTPSRTGLPLSSRYQNQASGTPSTITSRNNRRWR